MDARRNLTEYFFKNTAFFFIAALSGGRVFEPPMRRYGLARPAGAYFARRAIAHRNDEVHLRRAGNGKFVPAFTAQAFTGIAKHLDFLVGQIGRSSCRERACQSV